MSSPTLLLRHMGGQKTTPNQNKTKRPFSNIHVLRCRSGPHCSRHAVDRPSRKVYGRVCVREGRNEGQNGGVGPAAGGVDVVVQGAAVEVAVMMRFVVAAAQLVGDFNFSMQEYSELWLANCHNKGGRAVDVMTLA